MNNVDGISMNWPLDIFPYRTLSIYVYAHWYLYINVLRYAICIQENVWQCICALNQDEYRGNGWAVAMTMSWLRASPLSPCHQPRLTLEISIWAYACMPVCITYMEWMRIFMYIEILARRYIFDFDYVSVWYFIFAIVLFRNDEIEMFDQSKMFPGLWFVEQFKHICRQSVKSSHLILGGWAHYGTAQAWLTFCHAMICQAVYIHLQTICWSDCRQTW